MAQKKILVVDDDPDFVDAVTTVLESRGYAVTSAADGAEGFRKAKAENPDLILLDVMMATKTEGFDAARQLKTDKDTSRIPVVLVTGIRKEMNLPFGFEPDEEWLPVGAVLEKPVLPDILIKTVEEHIRR